jgi:hypothetical protein
MNTATRDAADIATTTENVLRQRQPVAKLLMHGTLPASTQEIAEYISRLLANSEASVCNTANG